MSSQILGQILGSRPCPAPSTRTGPRRPRLKGVLVGTALALCLATDAGATVERAEEFLEDAISRLEGGDINASIIQLRNALQEDPENLEARLMLGRLYLQRGEVVAAERELARVHAAAPSEQTSLLLGEALLGLGRYEEALTTLGEPATDPAIARQHSLLRAETLLNLGRTDEADQLIAAALADQPLEPVANLLAARASLGRGELAQASRQLETVLSVDPERFPAWLLKAQVSIADGDVDAALEAVDKAAELAPFSPIPSLITTELELRRGRFDAAEAAAESALELAPDNPIATYLYGSVLAARGDFGAADRALRPVADILRDAPEMQLLSGTIKARIGQFAQAESLLSRYLVAFPENRGARRLLASVQLQSGKPRPAAETLAPLVGPQSGDVASLQLAASAQLRAGDFAGARQSFTRLSAIGQPAEAQQARSFLDLLGPADSTPEPTIQETLVILDELRNARLAEAAERAEALVARSPDDADAHNLLGAVQLARGEDEAARASFEAALAIDPGLEGALQNLDRVDVRAGRLADVEARLRQRLEAAPENETLALQLAQLLARDERADEAEALLEAHRAAAPDAVLVRLALANRYRARGDTAALATLADELMAIGARGTATGYEAAGNLYTLLRNHDRAVEAFAQLAEALPDNEAARLRLARSQYVAGDPAAARATLMALREFAPENMVANNSMVDLALADGAPDEALRFARSIAPSDPGQAAMLEARVLIATDDPQGAADVLEEAFRTEPSSQLARSLFLARRQIGETEAALLGIREWLSNNPDDTANLEVLSQALILDRDFPVAASVLEQAVQLVPNDPSILNNLAWLRHQLDRPGAVELARRAHQLAPDSPEITDTLGWILVQEGDLENGLPLLREAHAALEENPDVQYHLAYALKESGEIEEARTLLEALLERDEDFIERERAAALMDAVSRL